MKKYKTNILIVDDTRANIISLEAILESASMNILTASSGGDALKMLLTESVDIVLLDVQMPDMNGFEVAELMRQNSKTKNIPIIFITAINKEEKYIFKGYELGAVDYLYKPINNEILKSKINVFVKLREQVKIIESKTKELEEKIVQLEIAEKKLNQLARIDDLTGVYNRRAFEEKFESEWFRSLRNKNHFSLLMIDIDDFKFFNDTYGHLEGDQCLKRVANAIEKTLKRPFDEIARFGGEEFIVLLPETDNEGARTVANDIRIAIEDLKMVNELSETSKYVTVSIGVAEKVPTREMDKNSLIDAADKALYKAKRSGKNRVCVY
ncbi:MAG: diguanylate cyclase [Clostridiales bacterium]|nr:diguanylate cyclase [Clostridiales bacterium]